MKILKIIHGYPPRYNAGSEVYSKSVCEELAKEHEVFVFTREEDPYLPDFAIRTEKLKTNLTLYLANMSQAKDGFRHKALDNRFAEILQDIKPDVAHIGHLNHLSTGFADVLKGMNIPIVFTLHDFWLMCPRGQFLQRNFGNPNRLQLCDKQEDGKCARNCYNAYFTGKEENKKEDVEYWTRWISARMEETRAIVGKVDLFIAPSNYLRERFIRDFHVPENKILYLDYGFPLQHLEPKSQHASGNGFTFGYIGTHIPAKGVNQLIAAFGKVKENASLKIWGNKDAQSTKALIEIARATSAKIEFKGEYDNSRISQEVFSQVDCIVVPSVWAENSPLVIHEAQACRVPVITADFGGMAEQVKHRINGLNFNHRDIEDLGEKLQWAVQHSQELRTMAQKGYLHSANGQVQSTQDHCTELVSIYKELTRKSNPQKLWRITLDTNPEDCNLSCTMCEEHSPFSKYIETQYKETGIKRRRMPVEWLDKIFKEAKEIGVKEIIPSTMGEPLLYQGIEKIYELARLHNIKINLTTNGTFPKKSVREWAQMIVPQTSDVKISWNGSSKNVAEDVMRGIDFQRAISNVREFVSYRNEHHKKCGNYCRVSFQLTFMQNNMHELASIIRLAAELDVDRVKGHHLWAHFEEIKSLSMKHSQESIHQWNNYVQEAEYAAEKFRRPNGEKVLLENIIPIEDKKFKDIPDSHACPFLGKELWISATGKISPCCAPDKLRDGLGNFGNIQNTSISKAISNETYLDLKSNYKSKELCKTCNMRKP